jgi:hypothetical protein
MLIFQGQVLMDELSVFQNIWRCRPRNRTFAPDLIKSLIKKGRG